jgi:hypothetical protein
VQWFKAIIPVIWEAQFRRTVVQDQPGEIITDPSPPIKAGCVNGEKQTISPKVRNQIRVSTIQHSPGIPSQSNNTGSRNEKI